MILYLRYLAVTVSASGMCARRGDDLRRSSGSVYEASHDERMVSVRRSDHVLFKSMEIAQVIFDFKD